VNGDAGPRKDVSPISFVSEDDPPVMQVHGDEDKGDKDNIVLPRTCPQYARSAEDRRRQDGIGDHRREVGVR
jgi:hypothetical protein